MTKLLAILLFVASLGCAEKVDCGKMKAKLEECGPQLVRAVVAGREEAKAIGAVSDSMLKSLLSTVLGPINEKCEAQGGKFDDAKAMNECLGKTSCDEFGACMAKHVH